MQRAVFIGSRSAVGCARIDSLVRVPSNSEPDVDFYTVIVSNYSPSKYKFIYRTDSVMKHHH